MKNTHIKEVTNDTRSVAAQYDKRKVNNYRPDFSLIMDFRLLMKDTGITLNQPYRTMEQRLLFVTGGNAVAEFNAIEYKLCKNVLILMPENCTMELLSASEDFNAHGLAFKVRGGENFGFIQYNALRMPLSDREGTFMEKYFQRSTNSSPWLLKTPNRRNACVRSSCSICTTCTTIFTVKIPLSAANRNCSTISWCWPTVAP